MWGQDPVYEHEILPALEQYAVRLIYDSECNHNLKIFSTKILEKMHRSKLEFMDVSWGLIAGWRDAIAECFDTPEKLAVLHDSETIHIAYNAILLDKIFHSERQAIYLQTWIASQMGWRFIDNSKESDRLVFRYNNGEHEVLVTLSARHQAELPTGQVISVEIQSAKQHTGLELQNNNPSRIVVNISTNEECDLPFIITIADPRRGTAVLKELFFQRPSVHYKEVLNYLSKIDLIL
jgi:glucose-6-phosphate dehydrogenase assembly protein OpcA